MYVMDSKAQKPPTGKTKYRFDKIVISLYTRLHMPTKTVL